MGLLALAFLMMRTGIIWLNVLWSATLPKAAVGTNTKDPPLVSVLIPARDEAHNIGKTIDGLLNQDYANLEVYVLDDGSTDGTDKVVGRYERQHSFIHLIQGRELPKGWLGKNWACHQLAQKASGDYFLFIDADVILKKGLIHASLQEAKKHRLTLLSVFPNQELGTWGEKIAVPMMFVLLLGLLPLRFVRLLPFPSMAAANGQVMFFDGKAYRECLFHQMHKTQVIEDISIARGIKAMGKKAGVYVGSGLVECRMYRGFSEVVDGFSKNILAGFGNSILGLLLYISLTTWMYWGLIYLPVGYLVTGISGVLLTNIALSLLSKRPILESLATHPFRVLSTAWIGLQSIYRKFKGRNEWKGRNIYLD